MTTGDSHALSPARQRDAELAIRLGQHDEEALRLLIDSCGKLVYRRAFQILQEPWLAEEVAQDSLLILWWDAEQFNPARASIRTFLVAIAGYKSIDLVRRRNILHSREALLRDTESFLRNPPADEEIENSLVVREAISRLPVGKREVLFLAFYRGLTYRQVAKALDLPEGTVKTRIRDALTWLKTAVGTAEAI